MRLKEILYEKVLVGFVNSWCWITYLGDDMANQCRIKVKRLLSF